MIKELFGEDARDDIKLMMENIGVIYPEDLHKITLNEIKRVRGASAEKIAFVINALAANGITLPVTRKEFEFRNNAPELWLLNLGTAVNEKLADKKIYSVQRLLSCPTLKLRKMFSNERLKKIKARLPESNLVFGKAKRHIPKPYFVPVQPRQDLLRLKLGTKILLRLLENNITCVDDLMGLDVSELYSFYGKDTKAADIIISRLEDPKYMD